MYHLKKTKETQLTHLLYLQQTFTRVVFCWDNVFIPDYLLCWIKGHLVQLLNLRDSALVTGHLCVEMTQIICTDRIWVNNKMLLCHLDFPSHYKTNYIH